MHDIPDDVLGTLEEKEYWEWKTLATEARLEASRGQEMALQADVMTKDAEIMSLKSELYRIRKVNLHKARHGKALEELEKFYKKIEENKGFDMRNCFINEYTREVFPTNEAKKQNDKDVNEEVKS
jgi:hypothetical protein